MGHKRKGNNKGKDNKRKGNDNDKNNKRKENDKKKEPSDMELRFAKEIQAKLLAELPEDVSEDDAILFLIEEFKLNDQQVVKLVKGLKKDDDQQAASSEMFPSPSAAMDSRDKGKGKDSFQEVKSKGKKKEAKEKSKDEDSNVNADNVPADSREVVENEKEILYN